MKDDKDLHSFMNTWFQRFPGKVELYAPDHWKLTQLLEDLGRNIVLGMCKHPSSYVLFLMMVGVWKNPHVDKLQDTLGNILKNSTETVQDTFDYVLQICKEHIKDESSPLKEAERRIIDTLGSLSGLGASQGGRAIVSAVLRFLDPSRYGTVDYRNWCILSNTGTDVFPSPLLEPLAKSVEGTRGVPIDTEHYQQYLSVIRTLGRKCNLTPAQVDMALFAFSDELWPFVREQSHSLSLATSSDKARRIMEVIDEVFQEVSKFPGQRQRALRFWKTMKSYERKGDCENMYRYVKNSIKKGSPPVGAKKTLESEFWRIEKIVRDP